ncbi:breast cancer metastasis-suppressor 1 isoform X1 [Dendrobates tinctorius]|uniref:breast cancer metastasis-suppressor 1 isoform X1 n=2 Tax=Dendrobates tinctorius TaxID=92724 RepID=UPI003CC96336
MTFSDWVSVTSFRDISDVDSEGSCDDVTAKLKEATKVNETGRKRWRAAVRAAENSIYPPTMEPEADSPTEMNGQEEVDSDREDSVSQSDSEEESSDMDDLDCERRRNECLDEMCHLEKQFSELKEKLFKERLSQLKAKLEEVTCGKALEYLSPLADLQNNMKIRIEVAGIYKGFCLDVIKNRYECELQGAKQHLESEKILLFDNMQCELLERIQRLEEDRQSIDISSEWWDEELRSKRSRRKWDPFRSKKRRVPLVSGPYIVYMLRDLDILEDWTAIKKAKASVSPQKRKSDGGKVEKQHFSARCEDGCLYYEGESFTKGEAIILDMKDEPPSQAVITAVSTGEVWLRRGDSSKTKIYVSQLQKGKYSVRRAGK